MMHDMQRAVAAHYANPHLVDDILQGLRAAGRDPAAPTPEDLAPVDEFHTAGHATTVRALEMMPLAPGMHVIDVGCGIGGAARWIAKYHGCTVQGVDLTADYVAAARELTARMGLSYSCTFTEASATELPFRRGTFDAAITLHAAMNIPDRWAYYHEIARVLRRGAPLCLFDVMKGPKPGMTYPVPWAETKDISVLKTLDETREDLSTADLEILAEENLRTFAIDYFRDVFATAVRSPILPPLGLHLLTGANSGEKFRNYLAALEAHQIEPVMVVARRR